MEIGMRNEFTAIYESDGEWVIAYCPEVPGANGQGHSREEARTSLAQAIALILEVRRDEGSVGARPALSAFFWLHMRVGLVLT
jgi:predicted RNase H-like HicB family nuclease